jgi:hypothetical protein
MKVTNWKGKVVAALLAAGISVPTAAHAGNVPLLDPSFEAYDTVPLGSAVTQYAYANKYRPTSAWIDDQDHNSGAYIQDNVGSNWLYSAAYAETGSNHRGSPRTGNQAMHGFFKYSTQESSAVFEAGKTYTFSVYAQGDVAAAQDPSGDNSRVWLYIFDGNVPFSEANSLMFSATPFTYVAGDFVNRDASDTAAQSQGKWRQLSLSFTAQAGAPYIGSPVGVGFYAGSRVALDDASLFATPEPGTVVLAGLGGLAVLGLRRRS